MSANEEKMKPTKLTTQNNDIATTTTTTNPNVYTHIHIVKGKKKRRDSNFIPLIQYNEAL